MITGESRLVEKTTGDAVIAGTVNGSGSLRVEVTGTGERTALAGIMRLVAQAQTSRSRAQALADRAAFWLTDRRRRVGVVTARRLDLALGAGRVHDRARGDGARHRLSARAGPRGAARGRDLHHARRAERPARARPARPRGGAPRDDRRLRQDGNAHARRASGRRDARRRRRRRTTTRSASPPRSSTTPSTRSRARSSGARTSTRLRIPPASELPGDPGARRAGARRRAPARRRRSEPAREARRRVTGAASSLRRRSGRAGAGRGVPRRREAARSRRSPSPTRCARSRARRCSGCTTPASRS